MIQQLFIGAILASGIAQAQNPHPMPKSPEITLSERGLIGNQPSGVLLEARRNTVAKKIILEASYWNEQGETGVDTREFATSYWPTAFHSSDRTTLYVAGFNSRGFTILERWTMSGSAVALFSPPQVGGEGSPQFLGVEAPRVASKELLFLDKSPNQRLITGIGDWDGTVVLAFDSARAIYRLDPDSPNPAPVLMASASSPQAPAINALTLGDHIYSFSVRSHSTFGNIVIYNVPNPGPTLSGVLVDADADGWFEQELVLDTTLWTSLGLGDSALYTDS